MRHSTSYFYKDICTIHIIQPWKHQKEQTWSMWWITLIKIIHACLYIFIYIYIYTYIHTYTVCTCRICVYIYTYMCISDLQYILSFVSVLLCLRSVLVYYVHSLLYRSDIFQRVLKIHWKLR